MNGGTHALLASYPRNVASFQRIGFDLDPSSRFLATGSDNSEALIYDLSSGRPVQSLRLAPSSCVSASSSASSSSAKYDGCVPHRRECNPAVNGVAFHPDPCQSYLAVATGTRSVASSWRHISSSSSSSSSSEDNHHSDDEENDDAPNGGDGGCAHSGVRRRTSRTLSKPCKIEDGGAFGLRVYHVPLLGRNRGTGAVSWMRAVEGAGISEAATESGIDGANGSLGGAVPHNFDDEGDLDMVVESFTVRASTPASARYTEDEDPLFGTVPEPEAIAAILTSLSAPPSSAWSSSSSSSSKLAHNYKTVLCKHFINGACHFGNDCHYAHGESEIRSSVRDFDTLAEKEEHVGTNQQKQQQEQQEQQQQLPSRKKSRGAISPSSVARGTVAPALERAFANATLKANASNAGPPATLVAAIIYEGVEIEAARTEVEDAANTEVVSVTLENDWKVTEIICAMDGDYAEPDC